MKSRKEKTNNKVMSNKWEERNEIFIKFEYNAREIHKIDDLKQELSKHYLCQGKGKAIPAAGSGGEIWFTLFINSDFFEFAKSVVAGGLAWDLLKSGTKRYFFKPFFQALEKYDQSCKGTIRPSIQKVELRFDDIDIVFGGLWPNKLAVVSKVFNEISKQKNNIESLINLPIIKIETPIYSYLGDNNQRKYTLNTYPQDIDEYLGLWRIYFMNGFDVKIYDLKKKELLDACTKTR